MDQICEEPHLDVTINENEIVDGAKEVIKRIRPMWPLDKLNFKVTNFIKDDRKVYNIYIQIYIFFIML